MVWSLVIICYFRQITFISGFIGICSTTRPSHCSILELSRVILTLHFLLRCNGDPTKHEDWTAWKAYRAEEPQIGSFSVRIYSDFLSIFWPEAVIHSVSAWRTFKVCQPKWQILNNLKDLIPIHICKMHPHHSALVKVS